MEVIQQTLRNLGAGRLSLIGFVLLATIVFFIYLINSLSSPHMSLLYGNLSPEDSGKIIQQLESKNIPFQLQGNGGEIWVPSDRALKLRMSMADQGLPGNGSLGYEIFDKSEGLGVTNFQQNVNLIRALEGELSRTIGTIDGVKAARVHLVLPKRELFNRESRKSSASITLALQGQLLSSEQVRAIRHLTASAVPSLTPDRISIIDNKGNLLAGGFEERDTPASISAKNAERQRLYEERLARTIEEMVSSVVGFGKVRAEVNAEMDFDTISTTEERFDPDGQVVRSTQTIETSTNSEEKEADPVTVELNLPDPGGLNETEGLLARTNENRTEETVNFEISTKTTSHIRDSGIIRKLSVAVLVDYVAIPSDGAGGEEEFTYEPRDEESMNRITDLVRSAIGYDSDRGDVVEVINMKFVPPEAIPEPDIELFWGLDKNDFLRLAETLVLIIVAVLVILLIIRPLINRAFDSVPTSEASEETALLTENADPKLALASPDSLAEGQQGDGEIGQESENFEELIDIERVAGRVRASSVKKVGDIIERHPKEALSILRSWMSEGA